MELNTNNMVQGTMEGGLSPYLKGVWRCVRNGNELDNHVIREKRKECEKVEQDREG